MRMFNPLLFSNLFIRRTFEVVDISYKRNKNHISLTEGFATATQASRDDSFDV